MKLTLDSTLDLVSRVPALNPRRNKWKKTLGGIGDNSKQETNYKSLFENLISMILEPKIDVDTYLKDCID